MNEKMLIVIKKDIWHLVNISQLCFESVSLVRGKFEGTRENLKHKHQALMEALNALCCFFLSNVDGN